MRAILSYKTAAKSPSQSAGHTGWSPCTSGSSTASWRTRWDWGEPDLPFSSGTPFACRPHSLPPATCRKTIQTAAYVSPVANQLATPGPFLVVAPLSTIPHWYREFTGWTDLNSEWHRSPLVALSTCSSLRGRGVSRVVSHRSSPPPPSFPPPLPR